jgi:hypothetical protein
LVLSALDTLPEAQFQKLVSFLNVIVHKAGLLWVVWLVPLLPLGAALQALGLFKEKFISTIGALLMCGGYIPWGMKILQGRMKCP